MKKKILIYLLFIAAHSNAQQTDLSKSLDSLIQKESESGDFSGAVIVAEKDKIIFAKSVGFANREKAILNDTTIKYNIASVGKIFTQVILLQLIEEGKIKLTDKIGDFYTGFNKPNANQITVLHLLTHTAGLQDVYVSKEYIKLNDLSDQERVVEIIANEKLKFIPGSKTDYSNSGYYLLGAIASKVENKHLQML